MAVLKFVRGNIFSQAIVDGQLLFDTTKNQLYIDVGSNRVHIGGTIDVENSAALNSLTPVQKQSNSLYYVVDENALYKYVNGAFKALTASSSGSGDITIEVEVTGTGNFVKNVEFVDNKIVVTKANVPTYKIIKSADSGNPAVSSYQLFKVAEDGTEEPVGDKINIPVDLVVKSGSIATVTTADQPYTGALVGDTYIDLVLNNTAQTHIYIPTKELANDYVAGTGIDITNRTISVKVVEENGLSVGDNGIAFSLATTTTPGAMSAEDKAAITNLKDALTWTTV